LEDPNNCVPFETVPFVVKKSTCPSMLVIDLRIIPGQRPELRKLHQFQYFTCFGIIEGLGSCSSHVWSLREMRPPSEKSFEFGHQEVLSVFSGSFRDDGELVAARLDVPRISVHITKNNFSNGDCIMRVSRADS
jgi:hypothetical protein